MKPTTFLLSLLAVLSSTNALSLPEDAHALTVRASELVEDVLPSPDRALEKRKGGGGKGGGSGGGGSRSSGGGSSSSRTSSTSNVGGSTRLGSGTSRGFAGGKYYGGGATVPYAAGAKSPRGVTPAFVPVPLFFPGFYPYGAYYYPYGYHHNYHNASRNRTRTTRQTEDANVTLPVSCICGEFDTCGCDENDDPSFYNELLGNGSYAAMIASGVRVSDVNGTDTLILNGTLTNGTTAPGGTDDAAGSLKIPAQAGMWALAGAVGYAVMALA